MMAVNNVLCIASTAMNLTKIENVHNNILY